MPTDAILSDFSFDDFDLDGFEESEPEITESEKTETNGFNQHKVIITNKAVDGGVEVGGLSAEDLIVSLLTEEADNELIDYDVNDDADQQELAELQSILVDAGVIGFDEMDYSQISYLATRLKKIAKDDELVRLANDVVSTSNMSLEVLSSSTSTLDKQYDVREATKLRAAVSTDMRSAELYTFVQKAIVELPDEEVNTTNVYKKLCADSQYGEIISGMSQKDIIMTLGGMISKAKDDSKKLVENDLRSSEIREKHSIMIIQDQINEKNKLIKDANEENISILSQVIKRGNKYFAKCNKCGEIFEFKKSPLVLLRVSTERQGNNRNGSNKNIFRFPNLLECPCGHEYLFRLEEYEQMVRGFVKSNENGLNTASQVVVANSAGDAYVKIDLPTSVISDYLPELVYEESVDTAGELNDKEEQHLNILVDDAEIRRASDEFYKSIRGFSDKTKQLFSSDVSTNRIAVKREDDLDISLMSYDVIARLYTEALSLDYDTEHSRALFSFLYFIKENSLLNEKLNYNTIWQLENDICFIERYSDSRVESLGLSEFKMLQLLALDIEDNYTKIKVMTRAELMEFLKNNIEVLKHKLESAKSDYNTLIDTIEMCKGAFAYLDVINVSSFKLNDYDSFIPSKRTSDLFNEIADRMIINNLSGDFYEYWEPLKIVNNQTLKKSLRKSSELAKARTSISRAMDKYTGMYGSHTFSSRILTFSYPVIEQHKSLRDAVNAIKRFDVFKFSKAVKQLPANLNSYVDDRFTEILQFVIKTLNSKVPNVTEENEMVYYFKEMFSSEEITALIDEFDDFRFNRWLLRRLDGESVKDYVNRFKKLIETNELSKKNSEDFSEFFLPLSEHLVVLIASAAISSMNYKSFSTTQFMCNVVNEAVDTMPVSEICHLLNFAEPLFLLAQRNASKFKITDDFEAKADFNKILLGHYLTGSDILFKKSASNYSQILLNTSESLLGKISKFNYKEVIDSIFSAIPDDDTPLVLDEGITLDRLEVLDEFTMFSDIIRNKQ